MVHTFNEGIFPREIYPVIIYYVHILSLVKFNWRIIYIEKEKKKPFQFIDKNFLSIPLNFYQNFIFIFIVVW